MEIPNHMHPHVHDTIISDNITAAENLEATRRRKLWAVILGLRPKKDGNKWSVLWGPNMMEGVCSFGDTPEEAMENFDKEMRGEKA